MNLVMTGSGQFIELQGSGEEATFNEQELAEMLRLGSQSIRELLQIQQAALSDTGVVN
jgi:ribonuclease PH